MSSVRNTLFILIYLFARVFLIRIVDMAWNNSFGQAISANGESKWTELQFKWMRSNFQEGNLATLSGGIFEIYLMSIFGRFFL